MSSGFAYSRLINVMASVNFRSSSCCNGSTLLRTLPPHSSSTEFSRNASLLFTWQFIIYAFKLFVQLFTLSMPDANLFMSGSVGWFWITNVCCPFVVGV